MVRCSSAHPSYRVARLVRKVCTVKIITPPAEAAAKVLRELGYDNVGVKVGDGYHGWLECSPCDAVIVRAALGHVPPPLIEQPKVGGWLVMPLGPADAPATLLNGYRIDDCTKWWGPDRHIVIYYVKPDRSEV